MRILVVDDEVVSRTKLHTLMQSFGDCQMAENGTQAVNMYAQAFSEKKPYQLIMLDIDMPDIQGTEVLQKIRSMEKSGSERATIVMVTAQSNQNHVAACVQGGCNDYITKPFDPATIQNKLSKMGLNVCGHASEALPDAPKSEVILKDINAALRSGDLKMPAIPQVGVKFREMVKNNANLDEMAQLLKQDIVIATKLIRLANSAMHRGFEKVHTLEQAIGRLGLSETEQLVSAIANQKLFMAEDQKYRKILHNLWQHSLACAYAADILANSLARRLAIDPFLAGLFHDVGALALFHIIAEMEEKGRYAQGIEMEELFAMVKDYHAMFGAKLMGKWGFGDHYVRVAQYHDNLDAADTPTDELLVLHFANLVAKALGYVVYGHLEPVDLLDAPLAHKLKLAEHQIVALQRQVESKMAQSADLAA